MNYIDIGFIAIIVLGLLFGLLGRLPRKIFRSLFIIGSVVLAYFLVLKIVPSIMAKKIGELPLVTNIPALAEASEYTINEFIVSKISNNEMIKTIYESSPTLKGIVDNIAPSLISVALFFVLGLLCIIIIPGILGIFINIFTTNSKKGTAIFSLGIFGAINGLVFALVICSPIIFLSPVLKDIGTIYTGLAEPKEDATQQEIDTYNNLSKIFGTVEVQVGESKVIAFFEENVMTDEDVNKNEKNFMVYTNESGEVVSMYEQLGSIAGLAKGAGQMMELANSLDDLSSLTPDKVDEIFDILNEDPELGKELVGGALEAAGFEGIDLTDVDLATEGETIKSVLEVMNSEEEITEEKAKELAADLASSELVLAVAESNEGMLADVDESTKTAIQNELDAQLNDPESGLSQEDYDTLMGLFSKGSGE